MHDQMATLDSLSALNAILEEWNRTYEDSSMDPVSILKRMAELIEKETEAYFKMDPDPFDDRHPGLANPNCTLGHLMKALFNNETFMNKLIGTYINEGGWEKRDVHTAACRLLLDIINGLETSDVFQGTEGLVNRLFQWASTDEDPLCYYAAGLLALAMELQDVASNFKDKNAVLVAQLLTKLHKLGLESRKEDLIKPEKEKEKSYFHMFAKKPDNSLLADGELLSSLPTTSPTTSSSSITSLLPNMKSTHCSSITTSPTTATTGSLSTSDFKRKYSLGTSDNSAHEQKKLRICENSCEANDGILKPNSSLVSRSIVNRKEFCPQKEESSNSSWSEMAPYVIGSYCMDPMSASMKQRLILHYLIPMGEYQELLGIAFQFNAIDLIMHYINLKENKDVRLAFEALKYLATLICHKKFATKFLNSDGVQRLLEVHRPSIAATGVSLCIYYLSYFEETMERVCLLPEHVLSELVNYVLWLLECSHESSRCHAAIFLDHAFAFRIILDLFDQKDGLRRLINVVSTLPILNFDASVEQPMENKVYTMRQIARYVCIAFKKYKEAHLILHADEIRRSHLRNENGSPVTEMPANKALKLTPEVVQENIEMLLDLMPMRMVWRPVAQFEQLGGISLVIQLLAIAQNWNNYPSKSETLCSAMDVLAVCTVMPQCQLAMLEPLPVGVDYTASAINIMIGLAEGKTVQDPEVQKSALNVIINCVWGPMERLGGGVGRFKGTGSKKRINWKVGEDVLSKMWDGIRGNNGMMVLLKLLSQKTPISEADNIRALACRALVGLSRSDTIRQIIGKLPLFNNGLLQQLMKEPVLQDKRQAHVKFCKYSNELIERVSGKHHNANIEASLQDIRKADIVAQTKITFQKRELLQLIYEHLVSEGYLSAASALQSEASLPRSSSPPTVHPTNPLINPIQTTPKACRQLSPLPTSHHSTQTPSLLAHSSGANGTLGPVRFSLNRHSAASPVIATTPLNKAGTSTSGKSQYITDRQDELNIKKILHKHHTDNEVTLDGIVTEYLRKQHALCKNPMVTCPPMSLFTPHKCPDPRGSRFAPNCITSRVHRCTIFPKFGGIDGFKCHKKYVYSRFKPIRTFRDPDEDGYSSCTFISSSNFLLLGTYSGDLKPVNIQTGEEGPSYNCHTSPITNCRQTKEGNLLVTSASWGTPLSSLWKSADRLENNSNFPSYTPRKSFPEDNYMEFSKKVQDKLIGTREEKAYIYDINSGQQLMEIFDQDKANYYTSNRATFDPSDDLVLNDGVLWDVRVGKPVHKFDKFNAAISGLFHPMGLEIIINSEVWDMRTFRLLHTVPSLDQCQLTFNHTNEIIYGTIHMQDERRRDKRYNSIYASTFRTFDSRDYSCISTYDVKSRSICSLAADTREYHIAVVETQQYGDTNVEENVCRLYEIGKLKDDDDDQGDDDDDEDEVMDDDDDDDDDDDEEGHIVHVSTLGDGSSDIEDDDDDDDDDEDDDDDDDDEDIEDVDNLLASGDESDVNENDNDFDDNVLFELSSGL